MRVLIVGGSGYLGQFLLKYLLERPKDEVIAVGYTYADENAGPIDHPLTKTDRCRAFRVDAASTSQHQRRARYAKLRSVRR